jgi:hypothetical protein
MRPPRVGQVELELTSELATTLSTLSPAQPSIATPVAAPVGPPPVSVLELLVLDPRLIPSLPLPTTLVCLREDDGNYAIVTTSRAAYEAARARRVPVFSGGEIESLVLAAEHDRGTPSTIIEWCARKAQEPTWRLTVRAALGPVFGSFQPQGWSLQKVLRAYWLELREVASGDDIPGCIEFTKGHLEASV